MSKRNFVRCALLSMAMVAMCGVIDRFAVGADSSPIVATMETFSHPNGVTYFAACLKPAETAAAAGPRDVVIVLNTSAGQVGEYRAKAIEALKGLLAALPAGDRVQLMALDLSAEPLTKEFVAPQSKQMAEALAALEARVPLGATDMDKGLNTVAGVFPAEAKNPRAVVYIGDGRSAAKLVGTESFTKLTQKLVDARIPVSSYIVGGRVDRQLPGALAVQTGGGVILDSDALSAAEAGRQLAAAAAANVLWPTGVTWPAEMTEVFPKRMPPLRGDRETVVFGVVKGTGPLNVQVTTEGVGGPQKVNFAISPSVSDDNNNYLTQLVELGRADGGVTLPLVGAASLAEARQEVSSGVRNLGALAREAMAGGNVGGAEQIAAEALRHDPNDATALAVKGVLAKQAAGGGAAAGVAAKADAPAAGNGDLNLVGVDEPPAGAMAENFEHDRRIIAQMVQTEVQNTMSEARSLMSTNPELASQNLKMQLEKVRRTTELGPDARDQLVDVLQSGLREAARRTVEVEHARQVRLENLAAAKEQALITDNLLRDKEKVQQLMARFNSLMQEGRYRVAEDSSAAEAQKLLPEDPVPYQARVYAGLKAGYENALALRRARQQAVVDTLYQVELSHIPMPDNPPILYPDAEVWRQLTARRQDRYSSVDLAKQGSAEKKIHEALNSPTVLEFVETPLSDVIDFLKEYHSIAIQLDHKALTDAGIGSDTPVTQNLKGISLKSALKLTLRDMNLTYLIQDEVLLITSPEEAEARLVTRVYPVADLVIPIPVPSMGGGGMGGGMMGGGGGMGGGMMGGGGGMGGGMGGGGMGGGGMGGGMGMMNLARELLQKVPAGGFQAFAVNDDLSQPVKAVRDTGVASGTPARDTGVASGTRVVASGTRVVDSGTRVVDSVVPAAKADAPATIDNRPAKIEIEIEKGAKPEVVWDQYFSKNEPRPAAVRDAVRQLMNQQKFDHVIALIGAALRHRQGQPWMYEALALALDAAGRPKAEIERAVMSAVEFVDNTADLMYIGAYLAEIGLHERALQVYRQAAELDPIRPEPYMLGLRAARALGDREGLKWASVGILSQEWPKEQADVRQAGLGVAKEVLDQLRKEKRTKEADKFLAALDQAVARDCVAVVTWTGEADVDVLVEEPSGTVCSLRSPRTTAGGILLGDASAQMGRDSYGGHSEVYVCPQGFDGTYRMLVRRVWGKVTSGKVNVEVITHDRTSAVVDISKKIPLDKDEALVVFELKNGRRKEALRDQQVANAVGGQLAMNRQILAQVVDSSLDPSVLRALALSRATSDSNANRGFSVAGAVGYQPQIIVLPEGTQFSVSAVISADRRYVRVTPTPFFSRIGDVSVFNYSTGESSSGTGGTGGQGFSGQ